jgi:allophanate hydrolase subunit 2
MDQKAFRQANLIVGNPQNAAVMEVLNGGLRLQVLEATVIAVTGAKRKSGLLILARIKLKYLYQPML